MAPAATTSRKPKEASKGRLASNDAKRPRKASPKKRPADASKPPSSKVSKSLLLPFITLWLLAIVALAALVYWGAGQKPSPGKSQEVARSHPSPPAKGKTADLQKQTANDRASHPGSSAARQPVRTPPPSRSASREGVKESDLPTDKPEVKPPVSDPSSAHSPGRNPSEHRAIPGPKEVTLSRRAMTPEQSRTDVPPTNNTATEIHIDVIPAEVPQPKPSYSAKAPEVSVATAVPPAKSPEPVRAPHDSSTELALMSPLHGPGSVPTPPPHPLPFTQPPLARVAIVIDDFGVDMEMARRFLNLPLAITFSIIPYQSHSQDIAQLAHSRHREIMLHMPMEPLEYPKINPGKGALLVSMAPDTIQKTFQAALNASPNILGMNNHMGSRFTQNASSMKIVLSELHQRGFYFLDSGTSPRSVGASIAGELQVPCGRRDIFLDHKPSEAVTRSQIEQLIKKAKIQGTAIAIGHPHESTLRAIQRQLERLRKEKIAVVPLREIILNR